MGVEGRRVTPFRGRRAGLPPRKVQGGTDKMIAVESLVIYVTSWFTYHAGQRVQNFYFFLAFQGVLGAFIGSQFGDPDSKIPLIIIGVLAVFGCIAFSIIEIRNTELIMAGQAALDFIEVKLCEDEPSLGEIGKHMPRCFDNDRKFLRDAILHPGKRKTSPNAPEPSRLAKIVQCIVKQAITYRGFFLVAFAGWAMFLCYAIIIYYPRR